MQIFKTREIVFLRLMAVVLSFSVATIPLSAVNVFAQNQETTQEVVEKVTEEAQNSAKKVEKEVVTEAKTETQAEVNKDVVENEAEEKTPVLADKKKQESGEAKEEKAEEEDASLLDSLSEMSTGKKVALGVGTVVLVGAAIALAGGSSDDGPSYPTAETMTGGWSASAYNPNSGKTYTGTYTFYVSGTHSYDLYVSDGDHLVGGGEWSLPLESYVLTMRNDTGSVYQGSFAPGSYSTIDVATLDGRWQLTLTKM